MKSSTPLRNIKAVVSASCLFVLLTSYSNAPTGNKANPGLSEKLYTNSFSKSTITDNTAATLYSKLNLAEKGLSEQAFEHAYNGYKKLLEKGKISNTGYLTICDLSQSSKQKRLYLIDINNNELLMNTWVAHGRNSGLDKATKFSNSPESLQSSLGFYVTKQTYTGAHGLSLRLEGLEPGFNNNAYSRAIVIHGADYIGAHRLQSSYMGRSYGCPAVPQKESATLINTIKNGTCLFVYSTEKNYLKGSKILND